METVKIKVSEKHIPHVKMFFEKRIKTLVMAELEVVNDEIVISSNLPSHLEKAEKMINQFLVPFIKKDQEDK